jgi:integrase
MRLTDITIRSLKVPQTGAVIYNDDRVKGFGVRVSEGGTKSFVLTHGPRRERETLGRVGVVTLQAARVEAKRRLAEYTLGKQRPRSIAWQDAVHQYLEEVSARRRPRTHESYKYALDKHFKYGNTKLSDLKPYDLQKNLGRLLQTPAEEQHAFVALRAFLRWAYRRHYFERNPMERMRAPHSYVARERVLTADELKSVWNAAGDTAFGRIVKLLLLTGQRVGEISNLTNSMVAEGAIAIPASLAKNGREHFVPIGPLAQSLVDCEGSESAYVFTAQDGKTRFNSFSTCKRLLDRRSGTADWRLHDLRRTFASGLASIGVALPVTERLLNHISGGFGGIVGVYQRYNYFPEMRVAIERWERHVVELATR